PRPHLGPWLPWPGDPRARLVALGQITAGLPLTAWGVRRRSAGWITAGTLLLAHGALSLMYELAHPRD
ncbi:membrane protein, partial [Streptomyces sp. MMG1533]